LDPENGRKLAVIPLGEAFGFPKPSLGPLTTPGLYIDEAQLTAGLCRGRDITEILSGRKRFVQHGGTLFVSAPYRVHQGTAKFDERLDMQVAVPGGLRLEGGTADAVQTCVHRTSGYRGSAGFELRPCRRRADPEGLRDRTRRDIRRPANRR
jgi:hypothetical protein